MPNGDQPNMRMDSGHLSILVVDSVTSSREQVVGLLSDCGYKVKACATSTQAIDILSEPQHNIRLILKEHEIEGSESGRTVDGCRLLRKLSKRQEEPIPVVFMSSSGDREEVFRCLSAGAVDFLVKPLRHNELRHLWPRLWCWKQSGLAIDARPAAVDDECPTESNSEGPTSNEDSAPNNDATGRGSYENGSNTQGDNPNGSNGQGSNDNGSSGAEQTKIRVRSSCHHENGASGIHDGSLDTQSRPQETRHRLRGHHGSGVGGGASGNNGASSRRPISPLAPPGMPSADVGAGPSSHAAVSSPISPRLNVVPKPVQPIDPAGAHPRDAPLAAIPAQAPQQQSNPLLRSLVAAPLLSSAAVSTQTQGQGSENTQCLQQTLPPYTTAVTSSGRHDGNVRQAKQQQQQQQQLKDGSGGVSSTSGQGGEAPDSSVVAPLPPSTGGPSTITPPKALLASQQQAAAAAALIAAATSAQQHQQQQQAAAAMAAWRQQQVAVQQMQAIQNLGIPPYGFFPHGGSNGMSAMLPFMLPGGGGGLPSHLAMFMMQQQQQQQALQGLQQALPPSGVASFQQQLQQLLMQQQQQQQQLQQAFQQAGLNLGAAASGVIPAASSVGKRQLAAQQQQQQQQQQPAAAARIPPQVQLFMPPSSGGVLGGRSSSPEYQQAAAISALSSPNLPGSPLFQCTSLIAGGGGPANANANELRATALARYREKKQNRKFGKVIRYHSRHQQASQRPRIKGQFVKHGTVVPDREEGGAASGGRRGRGVVDAGGTLCSSQTGDEDEDEASEEESGCEEAAGAATEDADSHNADNKRPRHNGYGRDAGAGESSVGGDLRADEYDLVDCLRQLRQGAPKWG